MITINGFAIDASLSEDHTFDNEITEYPIEDGSVITDHVRRKPTQVVIEGLVSDTPLETIAALREAGTKPSADALQELLGISDDGEPVTIETSLQTYTQMMLLSLVIPRDSMTVNSLRFRATFKEILLVTNERTTVEVSIPRAQNKANKGNKPSTTLTPDDFRNLWKGGSKRKTGLQQLSSAIGLGS